MQTDLVLKEERLAYLVDFSCPFDDNVSHKDIEKVDKYQDLLEIEIMWNVRKSRNFSYYDQCTWCL